MLRKLLNTILILAFCCIGFDALSQQPVSEDAIYKPWNTYASEDNSDPYGYVEAFNRHHFLSVSSKATADSFFVNCMPSIQESSTDDAVRLRENLSRILRDKYLPADISPFSYYCFKDDEEQGKVWGGCIIEQNGQPRYRMSFNLMETGLHPEKTEGKPDAAMVAKHNVFLWCYLDGVDEMKSYDDVYAVASQFFILPERGAMKDDPLTFGIKDKPLKEQMRECFTSIHYADA